MVLGRYRAQAEGATDTRVLAHENAFDVCKAQTTGVDRGLLPWPNADGAARMLFPSTTSAAVCTVSHASSKVVGCRPSQWSAGGDFSTKMGRCALSQGCVCWAHRRMGAGHDSRRVPMDYSRLARLTLRRVSMVMAPCD